MRHTLTDRFVHSAYHHLFFWPDPPNCQVSLSSSSLLWPGVVNPAHLMNLVLLQRGHWISALVLSFLKLVSILDISLSSRFLVFAKLTSLASVDDDVVEVWIYIDCPFSWLLNSLQNYLANSLSWGRYLRYRERTWNELVAKVERICNGPKMILLLRFLTGWAFSECKVTTISPYKKIQGQFFSRWTMLMEVNPCNVLKNNNINIRHWK